MSNDSDHNSEHGCMMFVVLVLIGCVTYGAVTNDEEHAERLDQLEERVEFLNDARLEAESK